MRSASTSSTRETLLLCGLGPDVAQYRHSLVDVVRDRVHAAVQIPLFESGEVAEHEGVRSDARLRLGHASTCHQASRDPVACLVQARGQDPVTLVRPSEAQIGSDVDLLLVGAPTHDLSMPKEQTRKQTAEKGATGGESVGIREWIEKVTPRTDLRVVTIDTSLKTKFTPGSAGPNEGRASTSPALPGPSGEPATATS